MLEVCSLPTQNRHWTGGVITLLIIFGLAITILSSDKFWLLCTFGITCSWAITASQISFRLITVIRGLAIGLIVALVLDAMIFDVPIMERTIANMVWSKIGYYSMASISGACLGLIKSYRN